MANKAITALTAATKPLTGSEAMVMTQGGNSRQVTTRELSSVGVDLKTEAGTSYTLVAGDTGKWIRFTSSSAVTLNVDDAVFAAGDEVFVEQAGSGVVTITALAGMTLNSRGSLLDTNGQYAVAVIKFISSTEAVVAGDLA